MIVSTLVCEEDHPSFDRFGYDLRRCLDQIRFNIPTETVHDRTRRGRYHRDLLHPVLPTVERRRIPMFHITYRLWFEDTASAPPIRWSVGKKLERTVTWPPCHTACTSDQSSSTSDFECHSIYPGYFSIDLRTVKDGPHTFPVERL